MKNTRILSIAVVLLLITNIALVAFMMMGREKKPSKKGGFDPKPSEVMVKELNMTEQQQQEFKKLKEEHFKTVKPYFDSVKTAKSAFYNLVKNPAISDSLINAYSNRVCEKQAELDKLTLNHFRQVRGLFTAEQQPKYDSLIHKMMQRGKRDSSARKK
jgi:Spy/CpxP family protein refolding chaperone